MNNINKSGNRFFNLGVWKDFDKILHANNEKAI